ncbi:hypothetical protein PO909_004708 [Leuciscus waleckii]
MAHPAHVSVVRSLYKRILLLHRFLPIDLRALGDQYVKDEFRRNKSASGEDVTRFMTEWQPICICCQCIVSVVVKWKQIYIYKRCYQILSSLKG